MNIVIANTGDEPIYEQIKRQIKNQIIGGLLKEGELLPSIRRLAAELQISVITTKRAYDDLEAEGFVETAVGRGTYVARQREDFLHEKKLKIVEELLVQAVRQAKEFGLGQKEVATMLRLLFEEEA
jgi:GntR family transcriptional regulator